MGGRRGRIGGWRNGQGLGRGHLGWPAEEIGLNRKYLEACRGMEMDGEGHDLGRSLGRVCCEDHRQGGR